MTNDGKENIRHVTCTNHTVRSDKDLFRVNPSKLSRRELEDLYFSVIENNTHLKKTLNGQKDQIKVLTTKVNRLTAQKNALGTQKDCCVSTRAIINEQKESIADLKKANERLSDRIIILNMRLCSAKQFLRRGPAQSMSRCSKCCLTPNALVKNSSMCVLTTKGSAGNLRCDIEAASSEFLNKANSTMGAAEMDTSSLEMKDEPCQQNKCRTVMDELKLKIDNLKEELSKEHKQYSERIHVLEEEMRALRKENLRIKALHTESEHRLEEGEKKAGELLRKLRDTELQCENLTTELQIEKSKVFELETQVKAADISSQVAEALEKHIKSTMETNRKSITGLNKTDELTLEYCDLDWHNYKSPPVVMPNNSEFSRITNGTDKEKTIIQSSDDSGYADKFEDRKDPLKMDQNILAKISNLQTQIDHLKLSLNDSKNKNESFKTAIVSSLRKSKSESTDTYAMAGGGSSLSNDITTTSRAPDVLSMEATNKTPKSNSAKTLHPISNCEPQNKFQIHSPLPIDLPRLPYFAECSNDTKYFGNSTQDGKDIISDSNSDKPYDIDVTKKPSENKVSDSKITEHSINEKICNENGYEKKGQRSSLKGSYHDKIKGLSVSYDQKKTILYSSKNIVDINENTQVNEIVKETVAPCQDNSDSKVIYKDSERNLKKNINNNYKQVNSENTLVNDLSDSRVSNKEHELSKRAENNVDSPFMQEKINKNSESEEQNAVKDTKVESSGTSSGNSTYVVERKPAQSKSNKDSTYEIENGNTSAAFQVHEGNDYLVCQSQSQKCTCTCPHALHRDSSVLCTCSGRLKCKITSSTKNKFKQCRRVRDSKTDLYVDRCPCQVGSVGAKLNGLAAKQSRMPPPIKTSTPNHKAMVVEASDEVTRSTSPDNTDQEISSLTDLPNEDKSPRDYISPGEERATSTLSDSYAVATTTDYGSLSLGEVPITGENLTTELQIEKSKVFELETQVKAADISSQVAEALEKHIKSTMETNRKSITGLNKTDELTLEYCDLDWHNYKSPPVVMPNNSEFSRITNGTDKEKTIIQSSDDSGYADKFEDRKDPLKMDQNILAKISNLQTQIDHLKLSLNDSKNKNESFKTAIVSSLRKSKSESTDTYAMAGGGSSLSNDITTTSRAPDVLSMEATNKTPKSNSAKTLHPISNCEPQNKFQIHSPLPIDLPRLPYFAECSNDTKYFGNSTQDGKDIISDSNSDKPYDIDVTKKPSENKVSDSKITEHSINEKICNENGYEKKGQRSSLKGSYHDKIKGLSVSYDQKKTILYSSKNIVDINENTQVNEIVKETVAPCQDNSDSKVIYKDSERNLKKNINNNYKQVNSENTLVNDLSDSRVSNKEHELSKRAENNVDSPFMQEKINKNSESEEQNAVKDTKVESSGTSSGNSTYVVERKPAQSKSNKDSTYEIENGNTSAAFQVHEGNDYLVCQSQSQKCTCTCPHALHRDSSVLCTCSGRLKCKITSSTKNKFKQCRRVRDSKTDLYVDRCPCQVGSVGAKLNGLAAKQSRMPPPIKTSTPNHKAMVVEASDEVTRSTSPDNTDQEISSLTDLPNEDKSPRDYISPGEERATSTLSDSYAVATTTDYGSLSLGEVPITGAKKLSNLEVKDKTVGSLAMSTTSNKMEEALQAISEELSRCRDLLQGQRPVQVIPGLLASCRTGRFSVD